MNVGRSIPSPRILAEGVAIVVFIGCGGSSAMPASSGPPGPDSGDVRPVVGAVPVTIVVPVQVLEPHELCSDYSDDAIATFEDPKLEDWVKVAFSVGPQLPVALTCGQVSRLTDLTVRNRWITSLVGVQNLTGLTNLALRGDAIRDIHLLSGLTGLTRLDISRTPITDISPLSGLRGITHLGLSNNAVTDLSPLGGLAGLTSLRLSGNPNLSDIQPLLDNPALEEVSLLGTNVTCEDVARLESSGVLVFSACD